MRLLRPPSCFRKKAGGLAMTIFVICGLWAVDCPLRGGSALLRTGLAHAVIDTYVEDFDTRQDETTINGVDSWSVEQGETTDAITQDGTTYSGGGKALQLTGAATPANVSRSSTYGNISPCWIEFIAKPGMGAQARSVPTSKIGSVYFAHTGKVYAADGSSWTDTGVTFTAGEWYRVLMKLNFATHEYDIYIEPVAAPKAEFIFDKEGLDFIDSSINSLSQIGFEGVYSTTRTDDTYIDDLIVHFIDRLEIITPVQTLMENQASSPVSVQLQNCNSEPQTAWTDISLELRSSSDKGEFSLNREEWEPISAVIIPEDAQQVTFYYKDIKEGKPIITAKEYPDRGWEEASQQEKVVATAKYFEVAATTPQVAGEYFTIEITAKDEDGGVNEYYAGEVEILAKYVSPVTGTMEITPDSVTGFSKGKAEVDIMYPDCGTIEIQAQDKEEPSKIGLSGDILFIPASFSVSAESPQVVSRPFDVGVSALSAQNQVCPNYEGPCSLSVVAVAPAETDGSITPASLGAGDFEGGLAEREIKYNRWGSVKLEAHDTSYPDKTGISDPVSFQPSALLVEVEAPSAERTFFYVGETIHIDVSVIDADKSPIPNYQGEIGISTTLGLDLPDEYGFTAVDEGKKEFLASCSSSGTYVVAVEDKASELEAESPEIEVREAKIEVISTVAPVGTAEVYIRLVDEEGNTISSENELTLQVSLVEEYDDGSASSTATSTPVTFKNGVAKVLISNSQAEIVSVSAFSSLDFKVKTGTVTFGRAAKTGIGTLMWREIKE